MVSWDSADSAEPGLYCLGRPRPLLRGQLHVWSALVSPLWAGYQLLLCTTVDMVLASALSLFGTLWLFYASGSYHTVRRTPDDEMLISKLDFIGIFLQVGFSMLPTYVVLLPRITAWAVVASLALSVLMGAWLTFADVHVSRGFITAVYIAQGSLNIIPLGTTVLYPRSVLDMLLPSEVNLLTAACVCYLIGSQIYAHASPALWPRTFGYHELWHLLVVVASLCTWSVNNSVLCRAEGQGEAGALYVLATT